MHFIIMIILHCSRNNEATRKCTAQAITQWNTEHPEEAFCGSVTICDAVLQDKNTKPNVISFSARPAIRFDGWFRFPNSEANPRKAAERLYEHLLIQNGLSNSEGFLSHAFLVAKG